MGVKDPKENIPELVYKAGESGTGAPTAKCEIGVRGTAVMAATDGLSAENEEFVYRICTAEEWEALQKSGSSFGGDLDATTRYIHLSKLDQIRSTLENFFMNLKKDLYLLQIDAKKLGEGLVYEAVDDSSIFPHFYGPSRSFRPLPLNAVVRCEKLVMAEGKFRCSLLS
ncbi:unnamed protein product [Cuscuta europaea]|uniref:Uncharacterized protein n=1 Tax=Cuscuta europaea TaxID=41803 RepID=A0A9P1E549_CUSEU|nr:unnamed protein product [Cuscuta europaea]